ncbi:MAG: sigma-70 family RNA polymerase sigma factor [Lachnospiraceae bacterium]|nr:sigma-70 family RNA polymerase sigma factor [Lachnospiraceae bacterium]
MKSDEELISDLRLGDNTAIDILMDRYKGLVRSRAMKMYILGGDREDLIQEGMIGLFSATRDYDPSRGASFATFAALCVSRQMYKAVQSSRRYKNAPLNDYVPIYQTDDDGDQFLLDVISQKLQDSPEMAVIEREQMQEILSALDSKLTPMERRVCDLYIVGIRGEEAAAVVGTTGKSVDNAMQRVRHKLRSAMEDG